MPSPSPSPTFLSGPGTYTYDSQFLPITSATAITLSGANGITSLNQITITAATLAGSGVNNGDVAGKSAYVAYKNTGSDMWLLLVVDQPSGYVSKLVKVI